MKAENFVNEMLNAADSILAVGSSFLPVKSLRYWYIKFSFYRDELCKK